MLLSVMMAASAAASPATAAPATRWDHPGYDAGDSYYNPGESVINARSVGRLATKWSVRLRDSGSRCSAWSAPMVTDGRVIVSDRLGISAYSVADGTVSWHFDWHSAEDNTTPVLAVSDGLLIAANGDCNSQSDPDGQLTAIDPRSGAVQWTHKLDIPVRSVVVDRGVVVTSGWSPSDEDAVVGRRVSDGKVLWKKAGWSSTGVSGKGAVVMRKTDGYGQADGGTSAIDIVSGAVRWSRLENWVAEAYFAGRFYVTDGRHLRAVSGTDGAVIWTAAGKAGSLIAVDGRRVYRVSSQLAEAFDARSGRQAWRMRVGVNAQPVRAGGLVHVGGLALRAADGTIVDAVLSRKAQAVVVGGRVYSVDAGVLTTYAP